MKKSLSKQHDAEVGKGKQGKKKSLESLGIPTNGEAYIQSLKDLNTVEYVRCKIRDCHVLKVPPSKSTYGWSATDLTEEIWQGTVKVVDRGTFSGIIALDRITNDLLAVWPLEEEVERCTDSSRYFILKVKNAADGKPCRVCLAFNERTQAFDFNVALATPRNEQQCISPSVETAENVIEHGFTVNTEAQSPPQEQTKPKIPYAFQSKHERPLKPPKNNALHIRKKLANKQKSPTIEIPDFANFDANFEATGDETAEHIDTSWLLKRLCCAT